jgi:hypothetical protein
VAKARDRTFARGTSTSTPPMCKDACDAATNDEQIELLVARVQELLVECGFGPTGYSGRAHFSTDLIKDRVARLDRPVARLARDVLCRLDFKGIVAGDGNEAVSLIGAFLIGAGKPGLSRQIIHSVGNFPVSTVRGRKPFENRIRNWAIQFAVGKACIWGNLRATRNRATRNDTPAECGASIVSRALRKIGGVQLSEARVVQICRSSR